MSSPLFLRRWNNTDVAAVMAAFAQPDMDHQAAEPITTEAAAQRWLTWASADERRHIFAVNTADSGHPIANIAVAGIDSHDSGWVSYWTAAPYRSQGIASAALTAVAVWAHDEAGVHRLELGYRIDNRASAAVARNSGFIVEGIERQKLRYGTVRHDVERAARLTHDPRTTPDRQVIITP